MQIPEYWRVRLSNSAADVAQPRLTPKLMSHSTYINVGMETMSNGEGVAGGEILMPIELARSR
jgi:hypothetical protein